LACAQQLSEAGVNVVSVEIPPIFESLVQAQIDIMEAEAAMSLSDEYSAHRDRCSERLITAIERGYAIDIERLFAARDVIKKSIAALEDIFKDVDVLLSPAAAGEAPVGLEATGNPMFGRIWSALGNPWPNPTLRTRNSGPAHWRTFGRRIRPRSSFPPNGANA